MLVYVDESGDSGFKFRENSSRYFVVAIVIFNKDHEAEGASGRIDLLRQQRRTPTLEYHFAKNNHETRNAFLLAIKQYNFTAVTFVVDKSKLSAQDFKDGAMFYEAVCGEALHSIQDLLKDAHVHFDEREGKNFQQRLAATLRKQLNSPEVCRIKKIKTIKSSADNLIQFADMICGAVARSFEEGDAKYYELIRHKIKVIVWPE